MDAGESGRIVMSVSVQAYYSFVDDISIERNLVWEDTR